MAYTQGFNPQPKLSLACPLPLFQEGLRELADIELTEEMTCEQFMQRLNQQLPPEVQIVGSVELPKLPPINGDAQATPSIASLVTAARYRAELHVLQDSLLNLDTSLSSAADKKASTAALVEALKIGIKELIDSEHLYAPVQEASATASRSSKEKIKNKNKNPQGKDIRPGLLSLKLVSPSDDQIKTEHLKNEAPTLEFEIATGSGTGLNGVGHIKPTDLLALLCPTLNLNWRITRLEVLTQPSINFSNVRSHNLNSI
jgi:hypothetical protein